MNSKLTFAVVMAFGLLVPCVGIVSPTSSVAFAQEKTANTVVWPIEIGLYSVAPADSIVTPGAEFIAKVPLKNTTLKPWSADLQFALIDFHEKERAVSNIKVSIPAGESKTQNVSFVVPDQGIFRVTVRLHTADNKTLEKDVTSVAAFPDLTNERHPDSFFGYHVNSFMPPLLQQAARLGVEWNRGHNMVQYTWWPRVQPGAGDFKWQGSDQRASVQAAGMLVLGQFFGTPPWAKRDNPLLKEASQGEYPSGDVPDLKAWREYIFQTVKHHPEIRNWEIWNEPDVSFFWRGTTEDLAKACQIAGEAAKAADPTVTVMAAGLTNSGFAWHDALAKDGAFKNLDGVSFHGYYNAEDSPETLEANFTRSVKHFTNLPKLSGVDKPPVLWDSEGGSVADSTFVRNGDGNDPKPTWRAAAISAVQSSTILQSLGVVRSFTYLWNSPSTDEMVSANTLDRTGAPKPRVIARAVLQQLVDGGWYAGNVKKDEGRLAIHAYRNAEGGTVLAMWTGRGGRVHLNNLQAFKPVAALDIMGNPIVKGPIKELTVTEEPVYLKCDDKAAWILEQLSTYRVTQEQAPEPLPAGPGLLTPQVPALNDYGPANRQFTTIDFRKQANMGLADETNGDGQGGWADEGPLNDMRQLETGRRIIYGVPFDIVKPETNGGKSVITLKGQNVTPTLPEKVDAIPIGGKANALYFLQAAAWGMPGVIGRYVVHYDDGQTVEIPLRIPNDVNDTGNTNNWHTGAVGGEEGRAIPFLITNTASGDPAYRYLRSWEWINPRPNVALKSFDFISAVGAQTPILVAVTRATEPKQLVALP